MPNTPIPKSEQSLHDRCEDNEMRLDDIEARVLRMEEEFKTVLSTAKRSQKAGDQK